MCNGIKIYFYETIVINNMLYRKLVLNVVRKSFMNVENV